MVVNVQAVVSNCEQFCGILFSTILHTHSNGSIMSCRKIAWEASRQLDKIGRSCESLLEIAPVEGIQNISV